MLHITPKELIDMMEKLKADLEVDAAWNLRHGLVRYEDLPVVEYTRY